MDLENILQDKFSTVSVKFLLKNIPDDLQLSEGQVRVALKQKKQSPLWVMLRFMDASTALVCVRVPSKSRNSNFTIDIKGCTIKAVKLTNVEEDEFELMLNSPTMEMFSSASELTKRVEGMTTRMLQVANNDLFLGLQGDIKYDLMAATSKHYQVYPFGSRVTGLGLVDSDYDVFIDMGGFYKGGGETNMDNSIQLIRSRLISRRTFCDFVLIARARVPVLKVRHRATGVCCDISTTNGIGVENTFLIRQYLSDRRVRFVVTAVKMWTRNLGLNQSSMGPGSLTSYCVLWMTLFALMQDDPPVVAPVIQLKKAHTGPKLFIDGWDCSFCRTTPPKSLNKKTDIELLYYFFNFYSALSITDFKNNVICPYTGKMIAVKEFSKTKLLPPEFENYKKQASVHKFYEMSCNSFMQVQDPIEQNHNIAKAVDDWVLDRFLKLCKTTASVMKNNVIDKSQSNK